MWKRCRGRRLLPIAALVLAGCRERETPGRPPLIVEEADPRGAGAGAGVRPGDVLLEWELTSGSGLLPRRGALHDVFDLDDVETEWAPRGRITLYGQRAGLPMSWALSPA